MKKISILIPTYNRTQPLLKNLNVLEKIFSDLNVINDIPVLISDDGSKESHVNAINKFIKSSSLDSTLYTHEKNLGIEENELFLVNQVNTEYAMLVGEDDYINISLFERILYYLDNCEKLNVGAIICNYYGIDYLGNKIRRPMFKENDDIIFDELAIKEIYRANQMTGLVFKIEDTITSYRKNCPHTVYPQLYFIGHSAIKGKIVFISNNPVANTVLKRKQFNYQKDNFTNEILSIYNSFDINQNVKNCAMKEFLSKDLLRYCNEHTWLHPISFLKKVNKEYRYDNEILKHLKKVFFISYFKIPYIILKHFWVRIIK